MSSMDPTQFRVPQRKDPLQMAGEMISLKDAMTQMKQRQQSVADQAGARQILAGANPEQTEDTYNQLMSKGYMAEAEKFRAADNQSKLAHLTEQSRRASAFKDVSDYLDEQGAHLQEADSNAPGSASVLWKHIRPIAVQKAQAAGMPPEIIPEDYSPDAFAPWQDVSKELGRQKDRASLEASKLQKENVQSEILARKAEETRKQSVETRASAEEARKVAGNEGFENEERRFRAWLPSYLDSNKLVTPEQMSALDLTKARLPIDSKVEQQARTAFKASTANPSDMDTAVAEYMKNGMTKEKAIDKWRTQAAVTAYGLNNPGGTEDKVKFIADQVDNSFDASLFQKLVGSDKKLARQVTDELATRGGDLHILTASSKQLGETAHELMPNFDSAIKMLDSPTLVKKMDNIIGPRWEEFKAGKVGQGDPEFDKLRVFINLLQTGTARAHVGARGSATLQQKFENMFNANKMDAATLKDSLVATKDFLKRYETAVYGDVQAKPDKSAGGPSNPLARATPPKVGDVVKVRGRSVKIVKIYDDGSFDGDDVK